MSLKYFLPFLCIFLCSFKPLKPLPKYGVQQCWLFSKQEFTGTIMVDENGKQITRNSWYRHFIYLETKANDNVKWQYFVYQNKKYHLNANIVNDSAVLVGSNIDTEIPYTIKPKKGNQLWLLNIDSFETEITKETFVLVLNGITNKQKIQFKLKQKTKMLAPDLRP